MKARLTNARGEIIAEGSCNGGPVVSSAGRIFMFVRIEGTLYRGEVRIYREVMPDVLRDEEARAA